MKAVIAFCLLSISSAYADDIEGRALLTTFGGDSVHLEIRGGAAKALWEGMTGIKPFKLDDRPSMLKSGRWLDCEMATSDNQISNLKSGEYRCVLALANLSKGVEP